jgi:hypothetical protein
MIIVDYQYEGNNNKLLKSVYVFICETLQYLVHLV